MKRKVPDLFAPPNVVDLEERKEQRTKVEYPFVKTKECWTGVQLNVTVGTDNKFGDNSKETIFRLSGDAGFTWDTKCDQDSVALKLYGDFELEAFIEALEFSIKTLKEQSKRK